MHPSWGWLWLRVGVTVKLVVKMNIPVAVRNATTRLPVQTDVKRAAYFMKNVQCESFRNVPVDSTEYRLIASAPHAAPPPASSSSSTHGAASRPRSAAATSRHGSAAATCASTAPLDRAAAAAKGGS